MRTYVLYHANCQDGLGAKYAAWKKFGDQATYIPVQYGQPLPEITTYLPWDEIKVGEEFYVDSIYGLDVKTADAPASSSGMVCRVPVEVYILDFSYPRDILEELRSRVTKLVILDHHKTAKEALEGFSGAHFDMHKSGAVLAWEFFHPDTEVPELLQYVQDRDLWTWKLEDTRAVTAALPLLKGDMRAWDAYVTHPKSLDSLIQQGETLLAADDIKIENALKNVKVLPYKGYRVGVMNTTTLHSEIGNAVCKDEELGVDFSLTYFFDTDGQPVVSFRSIGDFDVSVLAKELGGGGHRNASGARVSFDFIQQLYQGLL